MLMRTMMFSSSRCVPQNILKYRGKRNFYGWLNIVFNRRDVTRIEKVGPNRVAAEWILRNGGSIRFAGHNYWITNYNALPDGPPEKFVVEAINGRNASITNNGFDHLIGLNHLKFLDINGNRFVSDLSRFSEVAATLEHLDIGNCLQLSDVSVLYTLRSLKTLVMSNTLGKNREAVIEDLRKTLPNCNIIDDTIES